MKTKILLKYRNRKYYYKIACAKKTIVYNWPWVKSALRPAPGRKGRKIYFAPLPFGPPPNFFFVVIVIVIIIVIVN